MAKNSSNAITAKRRPNIMGLNIGLPSALFFYRLSADMCSADSELEIRGAEMKTNLTVVSSAPDFT